MATPVIDATFAAASGQGLLPGQYLPTRPQHLDHMIAAAVAAPQMLASAQLLQLQMEQGVDYLAFLKTTGLNGILIWGFHPVGPQGDLYCVPAGGGDQNSKTLPLAASLSPPF